MWTRTAWICSAVLSLAFCAPCRATAQQESAPVRIMIVEDVGGSNVIRVIDQDGVVLEPQLPLQADPVIWWLAVSDDGQQMAYVTGHSGVRLGHVWKYDFATHAATFLFDVPGNVSNIRWFPGDSNRILFSPSDQGFYLHDIPTASTTLWQTVGTLLSQFGKAFRYGLDWDASFTTFAFQGGTPYGAGDRVFVGSYCEDDSTHHICDIRPITPPSHSDANMAGNPQVSESGQYAFYIQRFNWNEWHLVRQDLTTEETVSLFTKTTPYGFWALQLFDGDRQIAFIDSQVNPMDSVVVCDVSSESRPVPCRTIYTAAGYINYMQVTRSPNQRPVADAGPDLVVEATGSDGASVQLTGSASVDPDGDALSYSWQDEHGSSVGISRDIVARVPLGRHVYRLTVDDGNGGVVSDEVSVTVEDTTPPVVTAVSSTLTLWPPSGKTRTVTISGVTNDSGSGVEHTGSYAVTDEYGLVQPHGTFTIASIGDYRFTVPLEASRLGRDQDGRVYLVAVTIRDRNGLATTSAVRIVVAHDLGK